MNEEKLRKAYKYLSRRYPNTPSVRPEIIKRDIRIKFELTDKEVYAVYYGWKRKITGIIERPKFKDINIPKCEIKESFIWAQNIDKLKELHERYKYGEDAESLASEIMVEKESLLNAFTRYKRNGVLHGNKKFQRDTVTIDGRKFSIKELKVLISRINNGEQIKDLAREFKIDIRYLSNAYYYHRKKFAD